MSDPMIAHSTTVVGKVVVLGVIKHLVLMRDELMFLLLHHPNRQTISLLDQSSSNTSSGSTLVMNDYYIVD